MVVGGGRLWGGHSFERRALHPNAGTWTTTGGAYSKTEQSQRDVAAQRHGVCRRGYDVPTTLASAEIFTPFAPLSEIILQMSAGLTILAPVGTTNLIQYVNDLNNTNWITLTNLVLPISPYIFIDYTSPGQPKRFYRAVLLP